MKKIYEFLVWDNCSNNCQFCWQRELPRLYNHEQRDKILQETLNFICSNDKFDDGSHILICGGEVFDKPQDFPMLSRFFYNIGSFMEQDRIELLYINTNLIYRDMKGVLGMLREMECSTDEHKNMIDRVRFTTSYDIAGRFRRESDRELMLSNFKYIADKYPEMHKVANTILTKPACEAILSGEFNVREFMETYKCWVNLIPYIVLDDELTADRSLIFKTLHYVDSQCPGYLERYVPNMAIKQEKWLYMYKEGDFQFCSCPMSDCGHSVNFKKYSKEGTCFCCDLENVFSEYC